MTKKDVESLIEAVRAIDEGAADYLENEAPMLRSYDPASTLSGLIYWSETPQGHEYWASIAKQLEGEGELKG